MPDFNYNVHELIKIKSNIDLSLVDRRLGYFSVKKTKPDLILMDIKLKGVMDGIEAAHDIQNSLDIPIVFITAPTAHYQLGVPGYLIEMKFAHNEDKVISMHKAYNEIVRQVAQIEGTYLLDLEVLFDSTPDDTLLHIFMEDGIHFTEEGVQEVAMRIADFIEAESLGIESPY